MKKYLCKKCGHINIEKRELTAFFVIRLATIIIISIILLAFTSIGLLNVLNVYNVNGFENLESSFKLLSNKANVYSTLITWKTKFILENNSEYLKDYANNLVKNCDDDLCKVEEIYFNLINFDYERGSNLNAVELIEEHSGDCDEMSYLLISLLNTQNIKSTLFCDDHHCVTIVKLKDKRLLLDITEKEWREL